MKMRPSLPSSAKFSWLVRGVTKQRCVCSSSSSILQPQSNSHIQETNISEKFHNFCTKISISDDLKQNLDKPILNPKNVADSILAHRSEPDLALRHFKRAKQQLGFLRGVSEPFCILVHILGDLSGALNLFHKILEDGLTPNKVTYAVLIEGHRKHGKMKQALELYSQMKDCSFARSLAVPSTTSTVVRLMITVIAEHTVCFEVCFVVSLLARSLEHLLGQKETFVFSKSVVQQSTVLGTRSFIWT